MPHFQIDLISNVECKKKLRGILKIHPTHLCGFKPGTNCFPFLLESDKCSSGVDACQGDSGGPASVLKNGRQTQVKERLRRVVGMNGWEGYLGWTFADWDCQPGKGMRGSKVSRTLHTRDFYLELDQERYGWVQSLE